MTKHNGLERRKLYMSLSLLAAIVMIAALLLPGVSTLAQGYTQRGGLRTVAFGDSNTQDFASGIKNWYEQLQSKIATTPIQEYTFTFNNQSVGGKSAAPTTLDGQNAQYDINLALNNITGAEIGFVALGTNDAYRGVTVTNYIASYKALISTVKASGKVGRLVILAVPPMTSPYNCLTGCFPFPNNPEVDRVTPFNQQLATLPAYCASIKYKCDFINSASGIPMNGTYIDPGTGIHMLNPAQTSISTNVYNGLKRLNFTVARGNVKAQ